MPDQFAGNSCQLVLRNTGDRARRLSATCYVEWVLGDLRSKSAMHVVTEADPFSGALFARNAYSIEFSGRVGFLDCDWPQAGLSGDRVEFPSLFNVTSSH